MLEVGIDNHAPPVFVGGVFLGKARETRVTDLRTLGMTDACMEVDGMLGGHLHDGFSIGQEPFGDDDPVAVIGTQMDLGVATEVGDGAPWIEEEATAVGFVGEGDVVALCSGSDGPPATVDVVEKPEAR